MTTASYEAMIVIKIQSVQEIIGCLITINPMKMLWFFEILFLSLAFCEARVFQNPVIKNLDNPDPGVIFYDGQYYATTTRTDGENHYPIYTSKDLQTWEQKGYIFNDSNRPVWATNTAYWAPEFHIVNEGQFLAYFTSRDNTTNFMSIGVAYAFDILGPYHALDRPLVRDPTQDVLDATVVYENSSSHYLIWKGREWMYGAKLTKDGLGFENSEVALLIRNDLPWEGGIIEGPWVIKRNETYFMFYSGSEYCTEKYAVGVAKSKSVLSGWEKKGDPILKSGEDFKGTGHCSVVKDVDGVNDVMIYHAYAAGFVCNGNPRLMLAKSVGWDENWPFMTDN